MTQHNTVTGSVGSTQNPVTSPPASIDPSKPVLQDYVNRLESHYDSNGNASSRWYSRIITDCNRFLSESLRYTPIDEISPEMIQEAINRVCGLGGKRYQSIASGLRECFKLASLDGAISSNPTLSLCIRESIPLGNQIDADLYRRILNQLHEVPGGYLFGIAGFADVPLESVIPLTYDECDEENHVILSHRKNSVRPTRIVDPDGISILNGALALYRKRMEDPEYAHINVSHILCTNRFGLPYERRQLNTISGLLREACGSPHVDIASFRQYIRIRQL